MYLCNVPVHVTAGFVLVLVIKQLRLRTLSLVDRCV